MYSRGVRAVLTPPPPRPILPRHLTCLHLSVSVFVGVTAALALPSEFLQLGLAALDGLGFRPSLALVLLQGGLRANKVFVLMLLAFLPFCEGGLLLKCFNPRSAATRMVFFSTCVTLP